MSRTCTHRVGSSRCAAGLPRQVDRVDGRVGADLEPFVGQPGDGDVGTDAAGVVQHQAVGHRAGLAADVARGQPLEQRDRPGPVISIRFSGVMSNIATAGPRLPRLDRRDRRGELGRPGVPLGRLPLGRQLGQQGGVGLVPVRPLPAARLEEDGAELALPGVERADPQIARGHLAAPAGAGCRRPRRSSAGRSPARTRRWSAPPRTGPRRSRPGRSPNGRRPAAGPPPGRRPRSG